ncbi:MAG: hypothetical protein Q8L48_28370 [Archangium sp.]|nr:hypothetical protein [Archangium sp.]
MSDDAKAVRLIGGAMCGLGTLLVAPSVLLVLDGAFSFKVMSCSLLFGVPLLISGVSRLMSPERY